MWLSQISETKITKRKTLKAVGFYATEYIKLKTTQPLET